MAGRRVGGWLLLAVGHRAAPGLGRQLRRPPPAVLARDRSTAATTLSRPRICNYNPTTRPLVSRMRRCMHRGAAAGSEQEQAAGPSPLETQIHGDVAKLLLYYADQDAQRFSLKNLSDLGSQLVTDRDQAVRGSAIHVHWEGLVRLSHMIQEMKNLPVFVLEKKEMQVVFDLYLKSFLDLQRIPFKRRPISEIPLSYVDEVTDAIDLILTRHVGVILNVAQVFRRLHLDGSLKRKEDSVNTYLNRFIMARIGIRFLFNQHLALTTTRAHEVNQQWSGSIERKCDVANIAEDAADAAKLVCREKYGHCADIHVKVADTPQEKTVTTVPSHLFHILFELLKNSSRAVIEADNDDKPIDVLIVHGKTDMTIKIMDQGGGVSRDVVKELFSYFYSTAKAPELYDDDMSTGQEPVNAPMAGFGYGLPTSRLYAQYFGGDLRLISAEGYGTDAYVYLRTQPSQAKEVLPSHTASEIRSYLSERNFSHNEKAWNTQ